MSNSGSKIPEPVQRFIGWCIMIAFGVYIWDNPGQVGGFFGKLPGKVEEFLAGFVN